MFILLPFIKRSDPYFKIYVLFSLIIFYSFIYDYIPNLHFKNIARNDNDNIIKKDSTNSTKKYIKRYIYYFYISVIIQSTVGLGDIIPITLLSQLLISTQALTSVITVFI
jgi:hypothetical protein